MKCTCFIFIIMFFSLSVYPDSNSTGNVDKMKLQKIADQLSQIYYLGGDNLGYSAKFIHYLDKKYKIKPTSKIKQFLLTNKAGHRGRWGQQNNFDYYSLLSGGLAIRESLQVDTIRASQNESDSIPVSGLKGPEVRSHPFKRMLQGRTYKAYALAGVCPEDFYYFHFSNMGSALDRFDYLNRVGGAVIQRTTPRAVDFKVKTKVLTQLAIVENRKARRFYDYVIEEMAVVGSDPFLRMGSDVSFICKLKRPSIFYNKMNGYRDDFISSHKAEVRKIRIAGKKVEALISENRVICSYLIPLCSDIVIISNSPAAVKIIIDTFNNQHSSLANADDFKYMRSIYKAGDKDEDAFLYLSDSFIRHLVGPRLRIKEARRLREAVRIAELERYGLFYYQLHGKRAASLKDLEKEFGGDELKRSLGLGFDKNSFAVISDRYGKMGYFKANIDEKLVAVSRKEADDYNRFLREYNNYWSEYFDPIGIRIKQGDGNTRIETCILPLINNSIYNSLTQMLGGKSVSFNPHSVKIPGEILKISTKIPVELHRDIMKEFYIRDKDRKEGSLAFGDIFKNQLSIGMLDARPMVDFDAAQFSKIFSGRQFRTEYAFIVVAAWSLFHPLRISIPLKDPDISMDKIEQLEMNILQLSRSMGSGFAVNRYYIAYRGKKINVTTFSFYDIIKFRLFSAVHNGDYIVTTTDDYMYKIIDSDRGTVKGSIRGNINAVLMPDQINLEKNMYVLNMMESARNASLNNYGTYKLFTLLFKGSKNIQKEAYRSFGFQLDCPSGGTYSIDKKTGQVINSLYGDGITRDIPINEIMKGDSFKRFFSTRQLQLNLEFTPEGIKTVFDIH